MLRLCFSHLCDSHVAVLSTVAPYVYLWRIYVQILSWKQCSWHPLNLHIADNSQLHTGTQKLIASPRCVHNLPYYVTSHWRLSRTPVRCNSLLVVCNDWNLFVGWVNSGNIKSKSMITLSMWITFNPVGNSYYHQSHHVISPVKYSIWYVIVRSRKLWKPWDCKRHS